MASRVQPRMALKRAPQLVGDRGQELVLHAVEPLGLRAGRPLGLQQLQPLLLDLLALAGITDHAAQQAGVDLTFHQVVLHALLDGSAPQGLVVVPREHDDGNVRRPTACTRSTVSKP